ncbi:hypothetical protein [Lutibacter maritimus]|jgi:hypothetical protein|uniref:Uncharacterized protein n=1 Tax=Lutibacter maritimus TaxID=593133 RepID=A0A1I6STE0_9FLAO|nr:hypothetical protein [Lutibacter maritimus]SFS80161.1 hypothetical protein SAMN04488006_0103 [Lutibacter maritimus]
MKLLYVKRTRKKENRFSPKMGRLVTNVTYIKTYLLGLPINTLHKYRETYYGEIKDCEECNLYV